MILLDTNVLIYASTDQSPFLEWARRAESGREAPSVPLPDFFIGAHAQIMGWPLATADEGRFRTYFPSVTLRTP
jgi:predicted nucleic acid-binding protein